MTTSLPGLNTGTQLFLDPRPPPEFAVEHRSRKTVSLRSKPISVFKLTFAQINLVERLIEGGGRQTMGDLGYGDVVAYQELSKLRLVGLDVGRRQKLWVMLTDEGMRVRRAGYFSDRVVVRFTQAQVNLLRHLDDGPPDDSVGRCIQELPGMMLDVCRRMMLRGWVEWYEGWKGTQWARLTKDGRELLQTIETTAE